MGILHVVEELDRSSNTAYAFLGTIILLFSQNTSPVTSYMYLPIEQLLGWSKVIVIYNNVINHCEPVKLQDVQSLVLSLYALLIKMIDVTYKIKLSTHFLADGVMLRRVTEEDDLNCQMGRKYRNEKEEMNILFIFPQLLFFSRKNSMAQFYFRHSKKLYYVQFCRYSGIIWKSGMGL